MARKKSKKFKGFKVAEKAHYFFGKDSDGKIINAKSRWKNVRKTQKFPLKM